MRSCIDVCAIHCKHQSPCARHNDVCLLLLARLRGGRGEKYHRYSVSVIVLCSVIAGNWFMVNDGTDESAIVMGISGKPGELVDLEAAHKRGVKLIRRYR